MSVWSGNGIQFLDVHFLDVGHGDCTIVEFPDRLTVVDINNCKTFDKEIETEFQHRYKPAPLNPFFGSALSALAAGPIPSARNPLLSPSYVGALSGLGGNLSSLSNLLLQKTEAEKKLQEAKDKLISPIDYLKANFTGQTIFRYIQSHPDMDHMTGLHRLWVEEKIPIANFWDTSHCIQKDEAAMLAGSVKHDIRDWRAYLRIRQSASNPTVLRLTNNGNRADFYQQDGIYIWAPIDHSEKDNADADPNALSYILCIVVGQCRVLLGGDATVETWKALYEANGGKLLKIHLLKASHHGRKSGYHVDSVKAMNPDLTVLSVGELKRKDDAEASYEKFSNKGCFSTVDHGTIRARCWGDGDVWLYDQDGAQIV
jgi:beta-lactamase superfamily II metal-dependent hydrolase